MLPTDLEAKSRNIAKNTFSSILQIHFLQKNELSSSMKVLDLFLFIDTLTIGAS